MLIPFDNTYAQLPEAFYAPAEPTPVAAPTIIALNRKLAGELGVDAAALDSPEGLAVLSGNQLPQGSQPIAMAYSGHQFGGFSPQLGDGRAILLGEVVRPDGVRFDIQLKGSGPTPFSRRGDGRSALGPVLREYIVSEAMAALGVPTTRALACVATGEMVLRECRSPGGVFTRVAKSHIRIGTFQWFAARRDHENLKVLADYVIDRFYNELQQQANPYLALLEAVIERQAKLIAHWMQLGFIHGVMNTDNMNISGETIDYGPCAFMDEYHPEKKFSSIDHQGRYAFTNQSAIGHWNLTRFAETLVPLIDDEPQQAIELAKDSLEKYVEIHRTELQRRLIAKIGIDSNQPDDWALTERLLSTMAQGEADFTLTFRRLADVLEGDNNELVLELFENPAAINQWLTDWKAHLETIDRNDAIERMRRMSPVYIPRNHRVEQAIQAAYQGDYSLFHRLNEVLQQPFTARAEFAEYEKPPLPGEVVHATFCGT